MCVCKLRSYVERGSPATNLRCVIAAYRLAGMELKEKEKRVQSTVS
jgi:hypothetical protein